MSQTVEGWKGDRKTPSLVLSSKGHWPWPPAQTPGGRAGRIGRGQRGGRPRTRGSTVPRGSGIIDSMDTDMPSPGHAAGAQAQRCCGRAQASSRWLLPAAECPPARRPLPAAEVIPWALSLTPPPGPIWGSASGQVGLTDWVRSLGNSLGGWHLRPLPRVLRSGPACKVPTPASMAPPCAE